MKESYFFRPIKEEVDKKREAVEVKPLTADEHEETEQKPMTLKDHWLSLRQSVQEKITFEKPTQGEQERIKLLSELITPELVAAYKQILRGFNGKAKKTKEHSQREFIDINSEEFSANIENWIENLISEVKSKREAGLDENDISELRAECWLLFDSVGNVMNTKSLEKDIGEFYKGKTAEEVNEKESAKQKAELVGHLQSRYPLDKTEVEILVDLVRFEKGEDKNYSPKILVEMISRLWGEYKLGERKGAITKISLGYLTSKGVESFAPSLFQNFSANDLSGAQIWIEFMALQKISQVIDAKIEIELAKIMNEVSHQINERITSSLFFQEFEFIHEKSLGEVFAILERGKDSTEQILRDTISKFAPTLSGIALSLTFLLKINPILGVIGMGSLPVMYQIAKKQNKKVWPMYEKEKREEEKISTRLGSIKSGFEEVKTSPDSPSIADHMKAQMDAKDTLSAQRSIEETKMDLKRMIPFDISSVIAAGIGGALQHEGLISGGAILSTAIYSDRLNRPIQELVNLYFNKFSRYIQNIQRMDEILGKYDKLDLPEGEKEKDRVSVSELKNFDISIKDLCYKNILRGLSLDIKQGEFLTIVGESGEGKTTLFRNLVGLYRSDGGGIEIGGVKSDKIKKYGEESIYSIMSYCNQSPQIFEGMTLRENILLWSKNEGGDEEIKQILKNLHLDKFADRLDEEIKTFSGGEKTRIGLARMLIKGAKIMLLDEPTTGLDSRNAKEFIDIVLEMNERYPEKTIICISQDERFVRASKRVVNIAELQK